MSKRTMHIITLYNVHYSENLPQVAQCSSLSLKEEGGCKHKMLSYNSSAQKAKTHKPSPKLHSNNEYAAIPAHHPCTLCWGKIRVKTQKSQGRPQDSVVVVLFFLRVVANMWLRDSTGLSVLAFLICCCFFCHRGSSASKADFLLLTCCCKFGR